MKKFIFLTAILLTGAAFAAPQKIAEQYQKDIKLVLKDFDKFGKQHGSRIELLNKQNNVIGSLLLPPAKYTRIEGYNDYINAAVILAADGRIAAVAVGKNKETPSFIRRIRRAGFMTRWNKLTPAEAADHKVDAVTRATYSCNAIAGEVKAVCREYVKNEKK